MVLAKISTLDPRVNASTAELARAKAAAWAEVLDVSMPLDWALGHVLDHYRTKRDVVMPADLNAGWRTERDRRRSRADMVALPEGVPMPAEVRAKWLEISSR